MMPELAQTMRPEYRSVTLTQLLSHQSGLPRDLDAALSSKNIFEDRRPLPQQRLEYVMLAMKEAPLFKPGTSVQYCNTGFILSGVIAERIMGVAYEDLMQREIFQPLGMSSAVFGSPPEDGPFVGHQAGHPARMSDGAPPLYGPAGPVRVTLGDWARFCLDALAGAKGKGRLLTSASYRLMQNPLPGIEDGLDWGIDASFAGRKGPVLEHSGTDRNWYALVNLFPATGDGILAVANAGKDMGGDKAVNAAFASLFPTVSLPSST